jgi:cation:H+ antiporter
MDVALVVAGLLLLFGGGEFLVRGAVSLAERFGLSKLIVGMVIVGFGTSTPELLVSLQAAMAGAPEIALGNVIGSNICNTLLILGMAAFIFPVATDGPGLKREAGVMTLVSFALLPLLFLPTLGALLGAGMLAVLTVYLVYSYRLERKAPQSAFEAEAAELETKALKTPWTALVTVVGLVALLIGARLLVSGATGIARDLGVSEAVIGLTVVAVGTSLPELATALVAAWRKHADVALANVIGSNIFNILAILGATVLVEPISVAARFSRVDGPVMAGAALVTLLLLWRGRPLGRPVGVLFLAGYALYISLQGVIR